MQKRKEKYIRNTKEIFRLMKLLVSPEETEESLLRRVHAAAEEVYKLRTENDHILRDEILGTAPENLTEEDCQSLFELALECSHFRNSIDAGAAYRIHSLLYSAAMFRGDLPHMIQELYYQGISLYYVNYVDTRIKINVFEDRIRGYFSQAAAYMEQFDQLPGETQGYVIRSMGNRSLSLPRYLPEDEPHTVEAGCAIYDAYMRLWRESMDVASSPEYHQKNPDFSWDVSVYSLHFDRLAFFALLRQVQIPRIANDLMESAIYVYQHQQLVAKTRETTTAARAVASYYIAQYHAYQITGDQLGDQLLKLYQERAENGKYTREADYVNLQIPHILDAYRDNKSISADWDARHSEQLENMHERYHNYMLNYPYSGYNGVMAWALSDELTFPNRGNDEFRVRMLDSLVSCHTPTYIHSCMVAYIARELITRLLEVNPQAADGVLGVSWQQLRLHRNVVCNTMWKCGIYHDMGKSMILSYVVIYNRSLLDEEFQVIKLHPKLSYYLLKKIPGDEDIAEVALRHHRNYNGRGGYPLDCPPCPPHLQVLVDALTVADCMDAATDNVGRCYAAAKSYDTLVEELFKFRGTRYAPYIVDLFQDKNFRDTLGKNLEEERKHTYYDVYSSLAEEQEEEK